MTEKDARGGGVNISNFSGKIEGAVLAGRDARIHSLGNRSNNNPDIAELRELLGFVLSELAKLRVSVPNVDFSRIEAAVAAAQSNAETQKSEVSSAQRRLEDALDGIHSVSEKVGNTGRSLQPIAEALSTAVQWATRIWGGNP